MFLRVFFFISIGFLSCYGVDLGVDRFFVEGFAEKLQGKRVGLITNATGVNKDLVSTIDLFLHNEKKIVLAALFAPEHGLSGNVEANGKIKDTKLGKVPVYS